MLVKAKEKDIIDQMLDQIDFHGIIAKELTEENGLLKQLTRRFYSKALDADMDAHLGCKKNDNSGSCRNGCISKIVITEDNVTIEVQFPRDGNNTFEPVIIPKHEKRTPLFNDQIISMYSFGMRSIRNIQRYLQQIYGVDDIFIACTDGLTGFPETVKAVFPGTHIQHCIVHMIRNSTKFVSR